MRVVIVNRFATVAGGAEKHAVGLAELLRERGHAVRFLSTLGEGRAAGEGAFVPLAGSDFWRGAPPVRARVVVAGAALWNRRAAGAMEALGTRFRPDIVHLHDIYPQLSVAPVVTATRLGLPVVQTLHNYELISASPIDHRGGWLDRGGDAASVRWLRAILNLTRKALHAPRVSRWIAVSRYVAATYARHGIGADVLPNFTRSSPPGQRAPFRNRRGIVFVGRLTVEKGARDVIALAELLPEKAVTIVGRGPLEPAVHEAQARLPNLSYAGELSGEEVAARLAAARLAVVPSRWEEPAGLVALEAMAEGTPVVAYRRGGLAEYVSDAGAGRVVSATSEELAAACDELYDDEAAWSRFAASGLRAVDTTHSPERYAQQIERLYEEIASG